MAKGGGEDQQSELRFHVSVEELETEGVGVREGLFQEATPSLGDTGDRRALPVDRKGVGAQHRPPDLSYRTAVGVPPR